MATSVKQPPPGRSVDPEQWRASRRLRIGAGAGLVAAFVALAVMVVSSGDGSRLVHAEFEQGLLLVPGLHVRVDGVEVGEIREVTLDGGRARVTLALDEEQILPLRQGTTARLRIGSTIGYANRYVDLRPAPASEPAIPDGGVIDVSDTDQPVEFDFGIGTFDRKTRGALRGLVTGSQRALEGNERSLSAGLRSTPQAIGNTAGVFEDLTADQAALKDTVVYGAKTIGTLARRDDDVGRLIDGLGTTLDAFAQRSSEVRTSLNDFAPTLRRTRRTLASVDATLVPLRGLVSDLRPGAPRLTPLARAARPALERFVGVGPELRRTLRSATRSAPSISALLREGLPVASQLRDVVPPLAPMVGCVRPYAPEIASFASGWGGFTANYDAIGHYARILYLGGPASVGTASSSAAEVTKVPGVKYAFPRPPGLNAGQPWFQPQCGVGPDSLDPSKDPERVR